MKKYRCPNCKQTFTGTPEKCPSCGVSLRYMQKEKPREVEEATVMNNFVPRLLKSQSLLKHTLFQNLR